MVRRALPSFVFVFALAACGDGGLTYGDGDGDGDGDADTGLSNGGDDGGDGDGDGDGSGDGDGDGDGGPPPELAEVAHDREFRGVWIASVSNINFPSQTGLDADALREELDDMVAVADDVNLNALVFQVRPESDALYDSDLEPWSRYLSGSQGGDPGFDPLTHLVEEAHAHNIEVHAWLNPYRAKANINSTAVSPHVSITQAEYAYPYGNLLWMDPGAEPVKEHLIDVIVDLVDRYDIDGIHFDDYFYPYPDGPFPDSATYQDFLDGGGSLGLADWRRSNVDLTVEEIADTIASMRDDCRFGISPFGIYRPGVPPGITGLDQYAEIFADPVKWIENGWVDYLAPQLYWPTYQTQQAYEPLLEWWSSINPDRYTIAGNNLVKLGESGWTLQEFRDQIELSRQYRHLNSMGNIFFHIGPLMGNEFGVSTIFRDEFYPTDVLTPPMADHLDEVPGYPDVTLDAASGGLSLAPGDALTLRAYVVYADDGQGGWNLERIVPAPADGTTVIIDPGAGRWAISAASTYGTESPGVVVEL